MWLRSAVRRHSDVCFCAAAALVVGADGRHSTVRERAGLVVDDLGAPIDVLWMRLSRQSSDSDMFMRIGVRKALVMLDRGDYWQCAFVIPKGGAEEVRQRGLQAFRADIVELAPLLKDRVTELQSWDDIKLLSVKVDRLREMASARPVVHRRRGACDVADWGRRHQSRHPGCGGRGEPALRSLAHRPGRHRGAGRRAAASDVPDTRNTEDADLRAEQFPAPCAFVPRAADATIADAPDQSLSAAAAHSGADRRDRIPSRAHCHAGRGRRGSA